AELGTAAERHGDGDIETEAVAEPPGLHLHQAEQQVAKEPALVTAADAERLHEAPPAQETEAWEDKVRRQHHSPPDAAAESVAIGAKELEQHARGGVVAGYGAGFHF